MRPSWVMVEGSWRWSCIQISNDNPCMDIAINIPLLDERRHWRRLGRLFLRWLRSWGRAWGLLLRLVVGLGCSAHCSFHDHTTFLLNLATFWRLQGRNSAVDDTETFGVARGFRSLATFDRQCFLVCGSVLEFGVCMLCPALLRLPSCFGTCSSNITLMYSGRSGCQAVCRSHISSCSFCCGWYSLVLDFIVGICPMRQVAETGFFADFRFDVWYDIFDSCKLSAQCAVSLGQTDVLLIQVDQD